MSPAGRPHRRDGSPEAQRRAGTPWRTRPTGKCAAQATARSGPQGGGDISPEGRVERTGAGFTRERDMPGWTPLGGKADEGCPGHFAARATMRESLAGPGFPKPVRISRSSSSSSWPGPGAPYPAANAGSVMGMEEVWEGSFAQKTAAHTWIRVDRRRVSTHPRPTESEKRPWRHLLFSPRMARSVPPPNAYPERTKLTARRYSSRSVARSFSLLRQGRNPEVGSIHDGPARGGIPRGRPNQYFGELDCPLCAHSGRYLFGRPCS